MDSVIAVSFDHQAAAYEALTRLEELDGRGTVLIGRGLRIGGRDSTAPPY
jgi:hypothetical protein